MMGKGIVNRVSNFFRNIDLRKFFGTVVGGIFFMCCVAYFTYAYYEWKGEETSIALTIHEADVACTLGPDVIVSNIGPVLKIEDGVGASFAIENTFTEDMAVNVTLDIISISEELLDESFKWAIVEDTEGGTNFDYENPIIEGSFKNFRVGTNLITTALPVVTQSSSNYEFIVYIDGTMKNDVGMMQNSMEASLSLGNCGEDYIYMDELTYFAFYSTDDNSLTFTYDYPVAVGDTYRGKTVTNLYTGYDTTKYNSQSAVPWYADGNYDDITSVTFLETTSPTSTQYWFHDFINMINIDVSKLDTSNVTTMREMFNNCNRLVTLNVDNFNTSNVTDMLSMFSGCIGLKSLDVSNFETGSVTDMSSMFNSCGNLLELDVSNFDTSKVTKMQYMFYGCCSLKELDLNGWNTSNVTNMLFMFYLCSILVELDLSHFDTSKVTNMQGMFYSCSILKELDLNGWNTSNVTNMQSMFTACESLINLNLENFDTSNVTNMGQMFYLCRNLLSIDVSDFDTAKVTNMAQMFSSCSSLTNLDLSSFDTSNVTNMGQMFYLCKKLTTTITIMNTGTTSYDNMFYSASTEKDSEGNYIGHITINYIPDDPTTENVNESTEAIVDAMIATGTGNIEKGCYGDNCPSTNDTIEEGTV